MTTTVPVYEALILFSESNLPGFVLKAERCQNHNGSANGNFGDCGDSVVAIARGFSGDALGGHLSPSLEAAMWWQWRPWQWQWSRPLPRPGSTAGGELQPGHAVLGR